MNNIIIPLIITFFAGLVTIFGIIPTYISNSKYHKSIIGFSISLSSSIMIFTSLFILLPDGIINLGKVSSFLKSIIIILNIDIGLIIIYIVSKVLDKKTSVNSLYKIGVTSTVAIIIHNIPEGIITFLSSSNNLSLGIPLAISIALHNIPEGISIAIPIYYSTNNRKIAFYYTFISGFSELIGGLFALFFLKRIITPLLLSIFMLITAGIMLYLSIFELCPSSLKYPRKYVFLGYLIGIIIMIINIVIN